MTDERGVLRRSVLAGLGVAGLRVTPAWSQTTPDTRGIRPAAVPGRTSPPQAPILMPGTEMHLGPIRTIALSGDGTLIATGSADRSIRLWRAATGEHLLRLHLPVAEGSIGVVDALVFSPNDHRLYAAGLDWAAPPESGRGMVYVFDLTTGRLTGVMAWSDDFASRLRALSVAPSGQQIAIAGDAAGLIVRDTEPGGFRTRYTDPPGAPATSAVCYSPDGAVLATASVNGRLRLLAVAADGEVKEAGARMLPGGGRPDSIAFSSDGSRLAISYGDRAAVQIVPVRAGAPVTLTTPAGVSAGNLAAIVWGKDESGQPWLFAGGTVVNSAGRNLLFGWRDGRAGSPAVLPVASDSITQLVAHPKAGVAFATSDPKWGMASANPAAHTLRLAYARETERLDFRGVAARGWGIDGAGGVVEFRSARDGATTLRFDLAELSLTRAATRRSDLTRPRPVPDHTQAPASFHMPRGALLRAADPAPELGRELMGTDDDLVLADQSGRVVARRAIATAAWGVALARQNPVAVVAHGDGTIRWYSHSPDQDLAELGGLFVAADEQRWLAWRADGRFAHSDGGGAKLVGFLQNGVFQPGRLSEGGLTGQWLDIDQLYRQLYDPDQVRGMLASHAPSAPVGAVERARLPLIQIRSLCAAQDWSAETRGIRASKALAGAAEANTDLPADTGACRSIDGHTLDPEEAVVLPQGTTAMRVVLSLDAVGPSAQVAVFVNEQNVGQSTIRQDPSRAIGAVPVEQHVPLFPGDNRVEFRAYGADSQTFTRAPTILRVSTTAAAQAPDAADLPKLHVLVAGIDDYRGTIPRLTYAKADAATFADSVQRRAAHVYAPTPVITLFDGDATVDALTAKLAALAAAARPADAVVIYFSGHGVVGTEDKSYAFVTADVTDANAVLRGGQGMGADRLARGLVEVRAERVFVFLDTCFAGGFDPRTIGYLNQDTGRYVLAASTRLAEAQDSYDGKNGLFAYAIKESLGGGVTSPGGSIDALDLGRYVTSRVAELAQKKSWEQRAVFQAAGQITAFPLFSATG